MSPGRLDGQRLWLSSATRDLGRIVDSASRPGPSGFGEQGSDRSEVGKDDLCAALRGYLDIFTAPNALVTLTGRESKQLRADRNGRATFEKLKLGVYSFKVDLADYQSEELKEFKVLPGRPTSYRVDLKPVFSTLVLGMGSQAASDVLVRIDDQPIAADQVEPRDGKLFVRRLR
jgi:hypothetical protein